MLQRYEVDRELVCLALLRKPTIAGFEDDLAPGRVE